MARGVSLNSLGNPKTRWLSAMSWKLSSIPTRANYRDAIQVLPMKNTRGFCLQPSKQIASDTDAYNNYG